MKCFGLLVVLFLTLASTSFAELEDQCQQSNFFIDNVKSSCHLSCELFDNEVCTDSIEQLDEYYDQNPFCICGEECQQVIELGYTQRAECIEDLYGDEDMDEEEGLGEEFEEDDEEAEEDDEDEEDEEAAEDEEDQDAEDEPEDEADEEAGELMEGVEEMGAEEDEIDNEEDEDESDLDSWNEVEKKKIRPKRLQKKERRL